MWLRKIKYKKLQYILMAIILAASAMIFSASLAYVQEVNAFVKDFYSAKNMPEVFITAKSGAYERITNDESLMKNIESIYFYEGKTNPELVKLNGETFKGDYTVFPITNRKELAYTIELKDISNKAIAPPKGEIWISYTYADQNDIRLGDKLTLGDNGTYTVSALTISATTATVFSTFIPYYINESDYSSFNSAKNYELILINSKSGFGASNLINSTANSIGDILDSGYTRESVASADTSTTNITGNIGIIASLIMFAAALFITTYIIKNNLQKELKSIGIYKSLGFSIGKIKRIYFKGYLLTAFIAALIGTLAGLPLIYAMSMPAVKYLGNFSLSAITAVCIGLSIVILIAITALSLMLNLRQIAKIKPVETLNMGLRSSTKKLKKSVIKSARSPLSLSINEIFKYSGSSIIAILMIALALFMSYTFGGIGHSMSFLNEKIGSYFAFPEGDIYIVENNSLYEDIIQKQEVASIITAKIAYLDVALNDTAMGLNIYILDDFDTKLTGIHYKSGREPRTDSEVALTPYILDECGLKVNDYVSIGFKEAQKTYLIVGSYTVMVGGSNAMQLIDNSLFLDTSPILSWLCVSLKQGTSIDNFKQSIENDYNILAYTRFPYLEQMANMVYGMVSTPLDILIIVFMSFSVLIILNMLFMNYMDNKKSFGTLKTLGVTTKYITLKSLFKVLILSAVGAMLGLLLGVIISPPLYQFIVGNPAYVYPIALPFELLGILIAIVTAITLLFAIPISKIKPKILMEE